METHRKELGLCSHFPWASRDTTVDHWLASKGKATVCSCGIQDFSPVVRGTLRNGLVSWPGGLQTSKGQAPPSQRHRQSCHCWPRSHIGGVGGSRSSPAPNVREYKKVTNHGIFLDVLLGTSGRQVIPNREISVVAADAIASFWADGSQCSKSLYSQVSLDIWKNWSDKEVNKK